MEVDLGTSVFLLDNPRLQLEIAAQVGLTQHAPENNTLLMELPEDYWITLCRDFHLSFSISLPDVSISTSGSTNKALMQRLARVLKNAALWDQLQCTTSLTKLQCSKRVNDRSSASFNLALGKDHTSEAGLDVTSVSPPSGVTSLSLSCVHISFKFFYPFCPFETASSPVGDLSPMLEDMPGLICPDKVPQLDCPVPDSDQWIRDRKFYHQRSDSPEAQFEVETYSSRGQDDLLLEPSASASPPDSIIFMPLDNTPESTQDSTTSPISAPAPPLSFTPLLSLTDAAIRSLIHPHPTRLFAGVKSLPVPVHPPSCPTNPHHHSLSDLAPTIFTPGYACTTAERAPLVAGIARTLSAFLRLSGRVRSGDEGREREVELRRDVWHTMSNGLRNPEASRRLKTLRYCGNAAASAIGEIDVGGWNENVDVIEFDGGDHLGLEDENGGVEADDDELLLQATEEDAGELDDEFEQLELFDDYEDNEDEDWIGEYGGDGNGNGMYAEVDISSADMQLLHDGGDADGSSDGSQLLDGDPLARPSPQQLATAAHDADGVARSGALDQLGGKGEVMLEGADEEAGGMLQFENEGGQDMLLSLSEICGAGDGVAEMLL